MTPLLPLLLLLPALSYAAKSYSIAAPAYAFGRQDSVLYNVSVVFLNPLESCDNIPLRNTSINNPVVLFAPVPMCFPEDIAIKALDKLYDGVVIANGVAPASGLWARSLWKHDQFINITVLDVWTNIASKRYLEFKFLSTLKTTPNKFVEHADSGAFIFLLVLAHIVNVVQIVIAVQRLVFNWKHGNAPSRNSRSAGSGKKKNIASIISLLHLLSGVFRLALMADPFGIYGKYSFPATNWLVFLSTTFSELGTFALGFSFHKILAQLEEEFNENNISYELKGVFVMSAFAILVNFGVTLLNNIISLPDSFFLVLNFYGLLQVYVSWYFVEKRKKVWNQEAASSATSKRDYRQYQLGRSLRLMQGGVVLNVLFLVVLQPIGLLVLRFGACHSADDCSGLLDLLLLGSLLMSLSGVCQLLSLPGETRAAWQSRMGNKSEDNNSSHRVEEAQMTPASTTAVSTRAAES